MDAEEALARLGALGFSAEAVRALWEHFDAAERRGKLGHGHARIPWLERLDGFDPLAEPRLLEEKAGFQRWHGNGAVGYPWTRPGTGTGRVPRRQCAAGVRLPPASYVASRSASRTTGSIASAPSTRSSRFSTPAQRSSASVSSPS